MLGMSVARGLVPGSPACSRNASEANNAKFMELGGKHASACPKSQVWLEPLAGAAPACLVSPRPGATRRA